MKQTEEIVNMYLDSVDEELGDIENRLHVVRIKGGSSEDYDRAIADFSMCLIGVMGRAVNEAFLYGQASLED